ncbi:unnamed protein product [Owenia fusiformis]|uniref:Uncharacterized protein n=1 Tax=Owenia fusiformis TaxID=6347 RepID=A0A8J1Y1N8_OWEFU|nr:unnamed protein product [Owenia fusiformis]
MFVGRRRFADIIILVCCTILSYFLIRAIIDHVKHVTHEKNLKGNMQQWKLRHPKIVTESKDIQYIDENGPDSFIYKAKPKHDIQNKHGHHEDDDDDEEADDLELEQRIRERKRKQALKMDQRGRKRNALEINQRLKIRNKPRS